MQHLAGALGIAIACMMIAAVAALLVIFRPTARRRRRRLRHSARARIDLFTPAHADRPAEPDA